MRWSKTLLTTGVLVASVGMTACKQQNVGSDVRTAKALPVGMTIKTSGKDAADTSTSVTTSTEVTGTAKALTCYQDLCEKNSELSYKTILAKAQTPTVEMKSYYDKNIAQPVKDALLANLRTLHTLTELIQQKETQLEKVELNQKQQELIVVMAYVTGHSFLDSAQRAQLQTHMTTLSTDKNIVILNTQGAENYLKTVQKTTDVQKAAQQEAVHIQNLQKTINSMLDAEMFNAVSDSIRRIASGESFAFAELDALSSTSHSLRTINELLSGPMEKVLQDLRFAPAIYNQLFKNQTVVDKILLTKSKASESLGACETGYYTALNLSPTAEAIEKFKKTAEVVRTATVETLSAQDEGRKAVASANLYFPRDRNSMNIVWLKNLAHLKTWSDNQVVNLKTYDDATILTYAIITGLTYREDRSLCADLVDTNISDSAAQLGTAVNVSWFSVMQPEYGVSILAHELAHLSSYESKTIENTKACLAKQQGSTKYIAEDYADLIAAKVNLKLQNTIGFKQKNLGCFLASADSEVSLRNLNLSDVHSSGLYRALQIALNRNEQIPTSCTTLLKNEASTALNRCE